MTALPRRPWRLRCIRQPGGTSFLRIGPWCFAVPNLLLGLACGVPLSFGLWAVIWSALP